MSSSSVSSQSPRRASRKLSSISIDPSYGMRAPTNPCGSPTTLRPYHSHRLDYSPEPRAASYSSPDMTDSPSPLAGPSHSALFSTPSTNSHEVHPTYTALTPYLAIADLAFAENAALLRRAGITHVVSVLEGRVHIPSHIPLSHRLHIPLADTPFAELVGALTPIVRWVSRILRRAGLLPGANTNNNNNNMRDSSHPPARIRILLHCAQGISRSPAVAAALLIALPLVAASPLSRAQALAYVAARRPAADINWGFRAQLEEWEALCRGPACVR